MNRLIGHEMPVINMRNSCAICGNSNVSRIMELPELPLTGRFSFHASSSEPGGFDQSLLWCSKCGHAQLENQVDPRILYDFQKYSFKTSLSATARLGTEYFLAFLERVTGNAKFNCVLDVGCNDLYLLEQLQDRCRTRIGIDPVWASEEPISENHAVQVIGETIENADLAAVLPCEPDLIVCRHTLEHIFDPTAVLAKLLKHCAREVILLFEVPSFSSLVRRIRFDQVFHEHLQYFSLSSFLALFGGFGLELIGFAENYHDWGAVTVAFQRHPGLSEKFSFPFFEKDIKRKLSLFFSQMDNTMATLQEFADTDIYGYGAALMLPVLAYHLKSDLSFMKAVLDDDRQKAGLRYSNLPLEVRYTGDIDDYTESTIFVTAVDNVKPIMTKLLQNRPKQIIYPLHAL